MAISHSFAGEHVEDRGGEKAGTDYDHHEIEHLTYLNRRSADPGISVPRFAMNAEPDGFDAR